MSLDCDCSQESGNVPTAVLLEMSKSLLTGDQFPFPLPMYTNFEIRNLGYWSAYGNQTLFLNLRDDKLS